MLLDALSDRQSPHYMNYHHPRCSINYAFSKPSRRKLTCSVSTRNFLNRLHRPIIPANSDKTLSISRGSTSSGFEEIGRRMAGLDTCIGALFAVGGLFVVSESFGRYFKTNIVYQRHCHTLRFKDRSSSQPPIMSFTTLSHSERRRFTTCRIFPGP